jgi:hypothetical protein
VASALDLQTLPLDARWRLFGIWNKVEVARAWEFATAHLQDSPDHLAMAAFAVVAGAPELASQALDVLAGVPDDAEALSFVRLFALIQAGRLNEARASAIPALIAAAKATSLRAFASDLLLRLAADDVQATAAALRTGVPPVELEATVVAIRRLAGDDIQAPAEIGQVADDLERHIRWLQAQENPMTATLPEDIGLAVAEPRK